LLAAHLGGEPEDRLLFLRFAIFSLSLDLTFAERSASDDHQNCVNTLLSLVRIGPIAWVREHCVAFCICKVIKLDSHCCDAGLRTLRHDAFSDGLAG